jgi:hypothetical protein
MASAAKPDLPDLIPRPQTPDLPFTNAADEDYTEPLTTSRNRAAELKEISEILFQILKQNKEKADTRFRSTTSASAAAAAAAGVTAPAANNDDDERPLTMTADDKDESQQSAAAISFYQPRINLTTPKGESVELKYQTKLGKFLIDTKGSDLYTQNSTPSWTILQNFNSTTMTDTEGRMYWLINDPLATGFNWNKVRDIYECPTFDRVNDLIFFVRPATRSNAIAARGYHEVTVENALPEIDTNTPKLFIVKRMFSGSKITINERWLGFVKETGHDELECVTNGNGGSLKGKRKTSYVVIHKLSRR